MNLLLTLTFCLTLSITKAFLLPREVNLGKAVDEDPEKRYAMPKNTQEELTFLMKLIQAFDSHPKIVDVLVSLKQSKLDSNHARTQPQCCWQIIVNVCIYACMYM